MDIIFTAMLILSVLAALAFGIYYYLEHYGNRGSNDENDYIWVGPGEHPLKEMRKREWKK